MERVLESPNPLEDNLHQPLAQEKPISKVLT